MTTPSSPRDGTTVQFKTTESDSAAHGPAADTPAQDFGAEGIAMIEHELRTSMTVVRGYLRMLLSERHGLLNPDQWSFASEARRSTERVLLMLDNLLELSNQRSGQALPVVRKPVHLRDVLVQAVATARPLLDDAGVKVELALDVDDAHLEADPDRLEQVFVNLLSNAVAHSPTGGRVSLQASVVELDDGSFVSIAIADQGPGVAQADAARIFEPFVRGDDAAAGGVGLGLAICERIMRLHGGSIESVPGAGRGLFRVLLPLTDSGA